MKGNFVAKVMNKFCRSSVEQDKRDELLNKIHELEIENASLKSKPKTPEKVFVRGDRVSVNSSSGFHQGARGVVEFVEPSGKVWVLRDGASGPVFFYPKELDKDVDNE